MKCIWHFWQNKTCAFPTLVVTLGFAHELNTITNALAGKDSSERIAIVSVCNKFCCEDLVVKKNLLEPSSVGLTYHVVKSSKTSYNSRRARNRERRQNSKPQTAVREFRKIKKSIQKSISKSQFKNQFKKIDTLWTQILV